jgi:hypothetical protein
MIPFRAPPAPDNERRNYGPERPERTQSGKVETASTAELRRPAFAASQPDRVEDIRPRAVRGRINVHETDQGLRACWAP